MLDDGSTAVAGEVLVGHYGEAAPTTVEIPDSADPAMVAERIEDSREVRYAIPNYVASASGWLPDDNGVNPAARAVGAAGGTSSGTSCPASVSVMARCLTTGLSPVAG